MLEEDQQPAWRSADGADVLIQDRVHDGTDFRFPVGDQGKLRRRKSERARIHAAGMRDAAIPDRSPA